MVAQAVRNISYIQAINEALRQEMERDENVIIMGEDIAGGGDRDDKQDAWGGPMRLTKGLVGQFGRGRIRDTPISEAGFIGAGVGAAASGLRPVVDLMYVGFYGVLRRPDHQQRREDPLHVRRQGERAADHYDRNRRGDELRRPALRDVVFDIHALPRSEVRRPV